MSKKRQERQQDHAGAETATTPRLKPKRAAGALPWHLVWRLLASLLVAAHLVAVFTAPWDLLTEAALPPGYVSPTDSLGRPLPPPRRDDAVWQEPVVPRTVHRVFHHYLNLLYANHGYEFFAPDPAGTHVIRYTVSKPDGTTVEGSFPNLDEQWPRLLYHRHMMLAEQTELMGPQSGQQYADHLATVHGGASRMEWIVHLLLSPDDVKAGRAIDDPSTYKVLATVGGRPRPADASGANATEGPIAIPGGGR